MKPFNNSQHQSERPNSHVQQRTTRILALSALLAFVPSASSFSLGASPISKGTDANASAKLSQRTSRILLFSSKENKDDWDGDSYTLFDRFRASCPADLSSIRQFDASLVSNGNGGVGNGGEQDNDIWAAVYKSSNNKPSVFIRDEFLNAMRSATSTNDTEEDSMDDTIKAASPSSSYVSSSKLEVNSNVMSSSQEKPVAVARLRPSKDFENRWILDSLQCALKKETTDPSCDGGSEYVEAIAVGVDTLIMYHLQHKLEADKNKSKEQSSDDLAETDRTNDSTSPPTTFEGSIRTKATLFSGRIFEDRGFEPVEELSKDMATHTSSFDACLERYAERSVQTNVAKSPGSRNRAHKIVALLNKFDREQELLEKQNQKDAASKEKDDYDPWASMKRFI